MNLISDLYSSNSEVANKTAVLLVQYFKKGLASAEEVHYLIMINQNYIAKLLPGLSDQPGPYENTSLDC